MMIWMAIIFQCMNMEREKTHYNYEKRKNHKSSYKCLGKRKKKKAEINCGDKWHVDN